MAVCSNAGSYGYGNSGNTNTVCIVQVPNQPKIPHHRIDYDISFGVNLTQEKIEEAVKQYAMIYSPRELANSAYCQRNNSVKQERQFNNYKLDIGIDQNTIDQDAEEMFNLLSARGFIRKTYDEQENIIYDVSPPCRISDIYPFNNNQIKLFRRVNDFVMRLLSSKVTLYTKEDVKKYLVRTYADFYVKLQFNRYNFTVKDGPSYCPYEKGMNLDLFRFFPTDTFLERAQVHAQEKSQNLVYINGKIVDLEEITEVTNSIPMYKDGNRVEKESELFITRKEFITTETLKKLTSTLFEDLFHQAGSTFDQSLVATDEGDGISRCEIRAISYPLQSENKYSPFVARIITTLDHATGKVEVISKDYVNDLKVCSEKIT